MNAIHRQGDKLRGSANRDRRDDKPIEERVYRLVAKCAGKLEAGLNRLLRPYNLTTATYDILRILEVSQDLEQSCGDISTQLVAKVPDMTRLLDRLERLNYVERKRSEEDRRVITVRITRQAQEMLEATKKSVHNFYIRELGHLGGAKLQEISELLGVLLDAPEIPSGPGSGLTAEHAPDGAIASEG